MSRLWLFLPPPQTDTAQDPSHVEVYEQPLATAAPISMAPG